MRILVYYPHTIKSKIDLRWLYGFDIVEKLIKWHPEWEFVILDGSQKNIYHNIDVLLRPTRHDGLSRMIKEAHYHKIPYIWSYETGKYVEPDIDEIEKRLIKLEELKMAQKGHPGRRGKGSCGGTRCRDGSGKGVGNKNTPRQPAKKKK